MNAAKTRRPYDAEHVTIVDMGSTVWALYIPDPKQAKTPRSVAQNITSREHDNVEVIACAQRYYKRDGATVPGWVITSGPDYGDPIPNKPAMLRNLREHTIPSYFHQADNTTKTTEEPQMPAATTTDFKPGQLIIVANGTTQTVIKMADRIGNEPPRVEVEGGLQWLASECEAAPRYVVIQAGFNNFVVRDTLTGIDASVSTSRSGAQHIADCLVGGIMVVNQDGRAIPVKPTVALVASDAGEFGVFNEDGDCIEGPYWHRSEAEQAAQGYRDEDEDGEYTVRAMCPEHEGQSWDNCTGCYGDEN